MTDPIERLEYFATNDTAHGGDCATPADLEDESDECPECGHSNVHGRYGCEYERGDAWVTGNQPEAPTVLMAQGPCGCKYKKPDSTLQDVFAYLRAVKRFGLALQQLGRRCDE